MLSKKSLYFAKIFVTWIEHQFYAFSAGKENVGFHYSIPL